MFEYLILGALVVIIVGVFMVLTKQRPANNDINSELNEHHRKILQDFNDSLNKIVSFAMCSLWLPVALC